MAALPRISDELLEGVLTKEELQVAVLGEMAHFDGWLWKEGAWLEVGVSIAVQCHAAPQGYLAQEEATEPPLSSRG